jgi:hypothetical protein
MQSDLLSALRRLTDAELLARLEALLGRERDAVAELIAHLAELDTRDLHLRLGYGSLYVYCRDGLALSESEANTRIEVARAARRFPVILEMLAERALNLTSARLLAPHLTGENHQRVLEAARGKRKTEVEEIVAALAPRPDVRTVVRQATGPLPRASGAGATAGLESVSVLSPGQDATETRAGCSQTALLTGIGGPTRSVETEPSDAGTGTATRPRIPSTALSDRVEIEPLAPSRYRLHVTIGGDVLEKLRLAKDLLRHAIPSGDDAAILDRALTVLLAELARKKFAATASHGHLLVLPPAHDTPTGRS